MLTITPLSRSAKAPNGGPRASGTDAGMHLHPSAHDRTEVLSPEALLDIAEGFGRVQQPIPPRPWGDPDAPRSVRLLATAAYDVWLITWPPGSLMGAHDHGPVHSIMHVVDGELHETVARGSIPEVEGVRALLTGESTSLGQTKVHSLANRSGRDATTVHAYSPPLSMVTFIDDDHPGDASAGRQAPVVGRRPVASSGDYHASGPLADTDD